MSSDNGICRTVNHLETVGISRSHRFKSISNTIQHNNVATGCCRGTGVAVHLCFTILPIAEILACADTPCNVPSVHIVVKRLNVCQVISSSNASHCNCLGRCFSFFCHLGTIGNKHLSNLRTTCRNNVESTTVFTHHITDSTAHNIHTACCHSFWKCHVQINQSISSCRKNLECCAGCRIWESAVHNQVSGIVECNGCT